VGGWVFPSSFDAGMDVEDLETNRKTIIKPAERPDILARPGDISVPFPDVQRPTDDEG